MKIDRIRPLRIAASTALTSLGAGKDALMEAVASGRGGLRPCDFPHADLATFIGRVDGIEDAPIPAPLEKFDCRNNRLAHSALLLDGFEEAVQEAIARHGAERIAVIVGTSTSGIGTLEDEYRGRGADGALPGCRAARHTFNLFSPADFVQTRFGLAGPAMTVSTACSSSAKVFAGAHRLMQAGICDAAVVGGVDSLCGNTLHGFNSLQLLSESACTPFGLARKGISIGEAAGFALLEWPERPVRAGDVRLLGYGESSDAYHMASPAPDGAGAAMAMQAALCSAGMSAADIDYLNLHGTGTTANDAAEAAAVNSVFGAALPVSGTKGWTGHTLGAAGIVEAIIAWGSLVHELMPGTLNTAEVDPGLQVNLVRNSRQAPLRMVMSNSFGFGGSNCSLIFGRAV